jgi:dUTPase
MSIHYTLELFPTDGNWDKYLECFGGQTTAKIGSENAGIDLYCVKEQAVPAGTKATLLDLGVKARMTKHSTFYYYGYEKLRDEPCHFWLAPRSSIWKNGVRQANSMGVIDRSYRGVLMGAVLSNGNEDVSISEGIRLFQILAPDMGHISRVVLRPLSELDETARGEGGFGSTG